MRTKTLLLSAAALAAGVLASQAQSNVFSANVVGYVNSYVNNQFSLLATPLDNSANSAVGSNDLNTLLGTLPNKSQVQVWNPVTSTFSLATKAGSPSVWTPDLAVPPGVGMFVKIASGTVTNTFVGQVAVANGSGATNSLAAGQFNLLGSPIPYSSDLNGTNLGLAGMPNKSQIQIWNAGTQTFSLVTKAGSPSVWSPDATINPGQGFFMKLNSATNWIQVLVLQ